MVQTIIEGISLLVSVGVLAFYIITRYFDNRAKVIVYIKHVNGLMVLILENIGNKYAYNVTMNVDKLVYCGNDVNKICQSPIILAPGAKLSYYIGKSYIHDGGILCVGNVRYKQHDSKFCRKYTHNFRIAFEKSTALTSHEDSLNSVLYEISADIKKVDYSLNMLKGTLDDRKKSMDIVIKLDCWDEFILIPKHMTFDCKLLYFKDPDIKYSNFNSGTLHKVTNKSESYLLDFYFLDYLHLFNLIKDATSHHGSIIIDGIDEYEIQMLKHSYGNIYNNSFNLGFCIKYKKKLNERINVMACRDYFKFMSKE